MAKETRELIGDCCVEFIHLLASEATEICDKETRKTITGDHVISALKTLGFESYIPAVLESLGEHNKAAKDREKKSFRLEDSGLTPEELLKSQEELFARARQRLQQVDQPPPSAITSPVLDQQQQPTIDLPSQLPTQLNPSSTFTKPPLSKQSIAAISIADLTVPVEDDQEISP